MAMNHPDRSDARVMRIVVPVGLIRDMDALIVRGDAGYETRAEFIVDAIQERLIELSGVKEIDAGAPMPSGQAGDTRQRAKLTGKLAADARTVGEARIDLPGIPPSERGFVLDAREDEVATGALFGLHNRDYPSLWALSRLATMAAEQPIPLEKYYVQVLSEAWDHGRLLTEHEARTGRKSTALFPTNSEKKKSAEAAFRVFAIGECRETADGLASNGPLFQWRVAGIRRHHGDLQVGLTDVGWDLLAAIAGLSAVQPHRKPSALAFLHHLQQQAPDDLKGLDAVVRATGDSGASRVRLLEKMSTMWPKWSENEVSTNSSGYVARAREWGLLEAKQEKGLYVLTEFGRETLHGTESGEIDDQ
jgi:hypothetical protein